MKHLLFVFIALFLFTLPQTVLPATPSKQELALIAQAKKRIEELTPTSEPVKNVIKVVYFHASDQAPLNGWQERLPRTLADVSNYYREAFSRYDLKSNGLPFEKVNGKIDIQIIQGDLVSSRYNTTSYDKIAQEIEKKANGRLHIATDNVLIINGLCDLKKDGIYYFHSPYCATGNICFVADCEKLDSRLLKDSVQKMTFTEMFVVGKKCSVGEFNSWYIGGIAHEMGHIFGLTHDFGGRSEFQKSETSMMGEYGSRHFRDNLWGGEVNSYFTTASILQLMSHPVFTGAAKPTNPTTNFTHTGINVHPTDSSLSAECTFEGTDRPYAMVALFRPIQFSEYRNRSFCAVLNSANSVRFDLTKVEAGSYPLRLLYLFPNGTVRTIERLVNIDSNGVTKVDDPFIANQVNVTSLLEKLRKSEKNPETDTKIEILKGILLPLPPVDLSTYEGNRMFLSDAQWTIAQVGWGTTARNYFSLENEFTFFLQLCGKLYQKGLYAHSSSTYVFNTDAKWKTFTATIGLRDYAHIQGSAQFTVMGDGKILYQSRALRVNMSEIIQVNISGVKELKLLAEGTEGHNHNSWAIWVDPILEK